MASIACRNKSTTPVRRLLALLSCCLAAGVMVTASTSSSRTTGSGRSSSRRHTFVGVVEATDYHHARLPGYFLPIVEVQPALIVVRGGSDDQGYDEDEDEEDSPYDKKHNVETATDQHGETEEDDEGEHVYDELEDQEEEEEEPSMVEEEEVDVELEEDYVQIEHEELFEDDEEEEEGSDTVTYEESVVVIEEEEIEIEGGKEDESPEEETSVRLPTAQVLERATAGTNTDDENSSAFVDRMELADAYDLEDDAAADAADASAVGGDNASHVGASAATAVGAGGSDPDTASHADEEAEGATLRAGEMFDLQITDEMRTVLLKELRFTPRDLKVLRPEIAAMLVAQKLQKPREGMPPNWYLPSDAVPSSSNKSGKLRSLLVKTSLTVVAVGTAALVASKGHEMIDLDDIQETFQKIPAALAAIPAAFGSMKEKAVPSPPPPPSQSARSTRDVLEDSGSVESAPPGDSEEEYDLDGHPHSVKPGAAVPAYEKDLDKTVLDKIITKIENAIKAFFRIKI